jgi:hypothetical protein
MKKSFYHINRDGHLCHDRADCPRVEGHLRAAVESRRFQQLESKDKWHTRPEGIVLLTVIAGLLLQIINLSLGLL